MDAFTKLREVFPDANENTVLRFLGPSQRIKIGRTPVDLKPYDLGDNAYIMAAFVPEVNTIFMRFQELVIGASDPDA